MNVDISFTGFENMMKYDTFLNLSIV